MTNKFSNPKYYEARKLMKGNLIFSDRIKNGRSIKCWGKLSAKTQRELAKLADKVVKTPILYGYFRTLGGETRYHFYGK